MKSVPRHGASFAQLRAPTLHGIRFSLCDGSFLRELKGVEFSEVRLHFCLLLCQRMQGASARAAAAFGADFGGQHYCRRNVLVTERVHDEIGRQAMLNQTSQKACTVFYYFVFSV